MSRTQSSADARAAMLSAAAAVAGAVVGFAGTLLSLLVQKPAVVVPFALISLAVIAVVPLFTNSNRARLAITLAVATALAFAGVAAFTSPDSFKTVQVRSTPSPVPSPSVLRTPPPAPSPPPATLVDPDLTQAGPVPGCLPVRFTAQAPAGYAFAVAVSSEEDPRLSFQGDVKQDPASGDWTTKVILGAPKFGPGLRFHVMVVMLEQRRRDYLAETRSPEGGAWWSAAKVPPEAQQVLKFDVRRANSPSVECA